MKQPTLKTLLRDAQQEEVWDDDRSQPSEFNFTEPFVPVDASFAEEPESNHILKPRLDIEAIQNIIAALTAGVSPRPDVKLSPPIRTEDGKHVHSISYLQRLVKVQRRLKIHPCPDYHLSPFGCLKPERRCSLVHDRIYFTTRGLTAFRDQINSRPCLRTKHCQNKIGGQCPFGHQGSSGENRSAIEPSSRFHPGYSTGDDGTRTGQSGSSWPLIYELNDFIPLRDAMYDMAAPNRPPDWQQQEHIRRHLIKLYGPSPYAGKFPTYVDYLIAALQGGYIEVYPETQHHEFRIGRIAMTKKLQGLPSGHRKGRGRLGSNRREGNGVIG